MIGMRRFLDRIWKFAGRFVDQNDSDAIPTTSSSENRQDVTVVLNQTIKKVTEDILEMRFNTAIAQMMTCANILEKSSSVTKRDFEVLLQLLAPFVPHITEEIWEALGHKESILFVPWPEYDESLLVSDSVNVAVQVSGKLRATITLSPDATEDEAKSAALNEENVKKFTDGKDIKKLIYVPGKIVNIVVG
jgi:leucyl-tRNA synthetase